MVLGLFLWVCFLGFFCGLFCVFFKPWNTYQISKAMQLDKAKVLPLYFVSVYIVQE